MPSVEASLRHLVIIMVIIMYKCVMAGIKRVPQIRCTEHLLYCLSFFLLSKTPGSTKVIFCSCPADCRIFLISVNVEFNFTFSVPVTFQRSQCHICTYILTFTLYIIQNHIIFSLLCNMLSSPLRMEISCVICNLICKTVIHLIKKSRNSFITLIFYCYFCLSPKRHRKIHIKSTGRIYYYGLRIHLIRHTESTAKQIPQRTFYRRGFLIIPIHTNYKIPQNISVSLTGTIRHSHPNMLNNARSYYLS